MSAVEPSACRHCGIPAREHFSRWKPEPVGWHQWAEPTQEQRMERMQARRAARLAKRNQEPEPVPEDCIVTISVDTRPAVRTFQDAAASLMFGFHPDLRDTEEGR